MKSLQADGLEAFLCNEYKKDILAVFAYEFELLRFLSEAQGFTLRDAMLSHRDVAPLGRNDVMFAIKCGEATHHSRSEHH